MIQPTQVSTAAARRTSHDDTTAVSEGGIFYALATAVKTAARTTKRFTRVSMLMLLLGSLMVIVVPQPAFATTSDHFAIGTFECPGNRTVEIGYGLIPAARGLGYAGEALLALMAIADERGIVGFRAATTRDNIASQRTLAHAGFELVAADDELLHYEAHVVTRLT